jgi:hypothetical protein
METGMHEISVMLGKGKDKSGYSEYHLAFRQTGAVMSSIFRKIALYHAIYVWCFRLLRAY